jgi:hypothetical protein
MYKPSKIIYLIVGMFTISGLAGCKLPWASSDATPALNVTQAYQTVEARLTQAIAQTPSVTDTSTPTEIRTATQIPSVTPGTVTVTPGQPTSAASPVPSCDLAAAGNPIDVTIPDDTQMQPGESFTKIWRLQNVGTCNWTSSYSVALFSGDAMEAPASVPLAANVAPNASIDLPVDMIAPQVAGTYQGNWKMQNDSGESFGIGPSGGSAFWVRIIVAGSSTLTPTVAGPTNTPGPDIQVSGEATLGLDDGLDLDSNQLNNGDEDLNYSLDAQDKLFLTPLGSAQIGVFGGNEPTIDDCQSASLSSSPVEIVDGMKGTYICYSTNQGLPGWLRLSSLDKDTNELTLQILTWAQP